ncbi:hypothetical protein [Streptomyces sp. NPDC056291]|uniref:hypothetical protein n=1 Tax=Streptomyces sp. NPDC056291 TaxID=3345772 RepID=UPI0035DA96F4
MTNPFPEIASSEDLDDAPTGEYIECVGCINLTLVTPGTDLVEWAKEHTRKRPWHTRFRVHHLTNFAVAADGPEPLSPTP